MEYQVVARRYRPQAFEELVGQEPIAKALSNAIQGNRIGHAYLFTGARGVGKTSSARIFAKALNCVHGPTVHSCNQCEICQSISTGDDIDVLEIDGASNRGIEDIRTLRQNVSVRPIRSRFKIYIIDEVHMLTREAFNALLKTLEEPPEFVKFIFCTTEAGKIPITILSRCQRFDFAGISTPQITTRLNEIVTTEGLTAEPAALELLARRAAGSMRDAQSLLEQLLAFVSGQITLADVHQLLGTASDDVLLSLLKNVAELDPASMLRTIDASLQQGGDPALLLEQLFGYFRDLMALAVGCGADNLLFAESANAETLLALANRFGLERILASMQILDHTLARMKISTQARPLAEMAAIRLCSLGNLENLADLIDKILPLEPGFTQSPALPNAPVSQPTSGMSAPVSQPNSGMSAPVSQPNSGKSAPVSQPNSGMAPIPGVPSFVEQNQDAISEQAKKKEEVPEALIRPAPLKTSAGSPVERFAETSVDEPPFTPDFAAEESPFEEDYPMAAPATFATPATFAAPATSAAQDAFLQALETLADRGEHVDELGRLAKFKSFQQGLDTWRITYDFECNFIVSMLKRKGITVQLEHTLNWPTPVTLVFEVEKPALQESSYINPAEERNRMRQHPLIQAAEEVFNAFITQIGPLPQRDEKP